MHGVFGDMLVVNISSTLLEFGENTWQRYTRLTRILSPQRFTPPTQKSGRRAVAEEFVVQPKGVFRAQLPIPLWILWLRSFHEEKDHLSMKPSSLTKKNPKHIETQ